MEIENVMEWGEENWIRNWCKKMVSRVDKKMRTRWNPEDKETVASRIFWGELCLKVFLHHLIEYVLFHDFFKIFLDFGQWTPSFQSIWLYEGLIFTQIHDTNQWSSPGALKIISGKLRNSAFHGKISWHIVFQHPLIFWLLKNDN